MKDSDLKILALIPARGGSKRLPGKNIKDFCGKPLIAWTIEEALKSKFLEDVIVSTDCERIAEISKKYGASVPFLRPSSASTDKATAVDVINHLIQYLEKVELNFTHILLLQPTSPLRTVVDIDSSVNLLLSKDASAVFGVCEAEHPPEWLNVLPNDQSFGSFLKPEEVSKRSQDFEKYYRLNGAIYLFSMEEFLEEGGIHTIKNSYA